MDNELSEKFVNQLVKILNDRSCFSHKREKEVVRLLVDSFLEFAREKGFGSRVEARGMREGLGALSGSPSDSYVVQGNDDLEMNPFEHALEIWLVPAQNKIQLTIQDERLEVGQKLATLISAAGVNVHFLTARQYKNQTAEIFNEDLWELSRECRH